MIGEQKERRTFEDPGERAWDMVKEKVVVAGGTSKKARITGNDASAMGAILVHLMCALGLGIAVWVSQSVESVSLISDPVRTLCVISAIQCPTVILLFSLYRRNPQTCSVIKKLDIRHSFCLPNLTMHIPHLILRDWYSTVLESCGTRCFGLACWGSCECFGRYCLGSTCWDSVSMEDNLVVLHDVGIHCSVFGSSWCDWQRIFAYTKPVWFLDYMVCLPAHGAIVGAWFGAWPMPLDWERPWQDWPICVSYGAVLGYLLGMVACVGFISHHNRQQLYKVD
ncbi:hypothetical protein SAY87_028521 [Trapa incisa]|uniref:Phosphatidylinositol-glycan biosynthesis class F protein n=1 Tax=Trapa incisa TaxID=236973 RepID=A0AAN7KU59_9MYRT|nr:hypothetical protein SAY87_028521 [Trapa incisa]